MAPFVFVPGAKWGKYIPMSLAQPIAALPFSRRGACPSLDEPMRTGDGLLARLRIVGGRLGPEQLKAIAQQARQHGNGLLEITARGNLQVRGLTEQSSRLFARAIMGIVAIETGLVVETPPLGGDDPSEFSDPRPLAEAIRNMAQPFAGLLGPKVTIIVDGGGQISLSGLKADIRLVAVAAGRWHLFVAEGTAEELAFSEALARVSELLQQLAGLGPTARAADLVPPSKQSQAQAGSSPIGDFTLRSSVAAGVALPFGSIAAEDLAALACTAGQMGVTEIRLAPHHGLLAIGAGTAFTQRAAQLGFITTSSDPRTRISACIGSDGCASGHIPARVLAARIAAHLPEKTRLHVSGCAKGCAHPPPADITLVGRADGYGLVIGGKAGDTPRTVLQADQLESSLAAR